MGYFKDAPQAFGVACLLALCLFTSLTTTALAEGNIRINGVNISSTKEATGEIDSAFKGEVAALVTIGTAKIKLTCNKIPAKHGLLFVGGEGLATITGIECNTYINGTLTPACKPVEPLPLASGKVSLFLHAGKTYGLIAPESGTIFATITFEEECAFGEKVQIGGSAVAECLNGSCESELVQHLFGQAPAGLFPSHALRFGTNEVRLDGFAVLFLTAADEGKKWSGVG